MTHAAFRGIEAVFFDVDDTLYDFEQSMRYAFEHLHAKFPDLFTEHKVDQLSDAYWSYYRGVPEERKVHLINSDPELFRRTMWAGALTRLGVRGELDALATQLVEEMQRERPRHWRMAMYEGAAELLRDLKPRVRLGVITNGPSLVQRPKLEALDYLAYFPEERVFVSGEFGTRKPDARIFRAAAASAGVPPGRCAMVGDAREFDMPAKAIGFRTILFLGPRDAPDVSKDGHAPDAIARSYADIRRLLL
jgi:putative hydrolase of the HAD superfamily